MNREDEACFLFNRFGGPESGEDPTPRCCAQSVYIPPPREHSAASRVSHCSLMTLNNTHRSYTLKLTNDV